MKLRNYLLLSISTILLASCSSEAITNDTPAEDRLPLRLEATLSSSRAVTRAVGNTFEDNDKLISYVQHVSGTTSVKAQLVTFTLATQSTSMYWDDFSDSSKGETDLRTENHGLRSYYGYCYNGGTPVENSFKETDGELKWTIATDQTSAEKLKHNDLLWSKTSETVSYNHAKDSHGTLPIPFTHAMSKFTIVVVAGDGFKKGDLAATTVTLKNVTKSGTFTAPSTTVTEPTELVDVVMCPSGTDEATTRTYEAITVPLTELTEDETLAVIENAGGNKYEIKVTKGILGTSDPVLANNWSAGLTESKTQSGINYKLTVTLNKQTVDVNATLVDWNGVDADGTGIIKFSADVTNSGVTGGAFQSDVEFSLWRATDLSSFTDNPTTAVKYNGSTSSFEYSPILYWENASTNYYFRALAELTSGNAITAVTNKEVNQGTDLLWGTTKEHIVTNSESKEVTYKEGDPINPRTGDVPLEFKHAMSNVVVVLKSVSGDAAVTLTDATFKVTNLSTKGTVDLAEGKIATSSVVADALTSGTSETSYIMVPQTIGDTSKLIVTLSDGTTYSLQLNTCKDGSDKAIGTWASGNEYTYTITLKKEEAKFSVKVQEWKTTNGSGNANLEWD